MDSNSLPADNVKDDAPTRKPPPLTEEPYTVFPPCVVHNVHEVYPYNSVDKSYNVADKEKIAASDRPDGETPSSRSSKKSKFGCFSKISAAVTWGLEAGFFRVGLFVGEYPVLTIVTMLVMCGLCGLGMKTFHETEEQEKLWVPQSSRLILEKAWVDKAFPQETRFVSILAVEPNGNILTPSAINAIMDYYSESNRFDGNGKKFKEMCVKAGLSCYVSSLLELWFYDETVIRNLTEKAVIQKVNDTLVSPVSGVEVKTLLGGDLTYDEDGMIVAAEATQITWVLRKEDNSDAADWEKKMIDMALQGSPGIAKTFVYASRSFDDEGYGAINNDTKRLAAGFSIVFVFIMLSLGKFNLLEQKIYLSLSGMACVGLAILVSYGISTVVGAIFSPIQTILPFLLLGIGVDDMFVVIETWKNLSPEEEKLDVPNKLAMTLSRAGVSITVTSITDIAAFGIGATTVIPALSAFCIYAAFGIFALYILVSTVFASVLALDDRRRKARRDACFCCYRHPESYTPNKCSTGRSFMQILFSKCLGPVIIKPPVKIFVILAAVVLACLGLWRFVKMPQEFDIVNYIPQDSYAYTYSRTKEDYFSRQGVDTNIYCGGFDYFEERQHLQDLHDKISGDRYIQRGTINSWFTAFNMMPNISGRAITNGDDFNHALYAFLHSRFGQRFAAYVKFNSTTEPVSIKASYITMKHSRQATSSGNVDAMESLRKDIDTTGFPKFQGEDLPEYMCFAYTREYMSYETNKVLQEELYRNLGLAAAAVFLVTLILIANLWTSLLVFVCVLFTVVDVGGALELWGTTIDTASSILLTLSVGLAVDFSAHIGHTFMTLRGSRNNRVIVTLKTIGPAVFNGGFSTFLAFVLLADSASYGFQLFFRVFFTVVVFGLFHGLVLLPALLSFVGPKAYEHADEIPDKIVMNVNDDPIPGSQEYHEMSDKPTENGHEQPSPLTYDGPVLTIYKQPDDVIEVRSSRRLPSYYKPLPTIAEDINRRPSHISVINVPAPRPVHSLNGGERVLKEDGLTKF